MNDLFSQEFDKSKYNAFDQLFFCIFVVEFIFMLHRSSHSAFFFLRLHPINGLATSGLYSGTVHRLLLSQINDLYGDALHVLCRSALIGFSCRRGGRLFSLP